MPLDAHDAVAKHARALERMRITFETLDAVLELLKTGEDNVPGSYALAVRLVGRERESIGNAIEALE